MRFLLTAIGKSVKSSPEHVLFEAYRTRLSAWPLILKEVEIKKELPAAARKKEETALLLKNTEEVEKRIALDETGKSMSSREFAQLLAHWQTEGVRSVAFLIGGADGFDHTQLKGKVDDTLSFGRLTFPHMMVRALIAEQLYRAYTIIINHPYHRD